MFNFHLSWRSLLKERYSWNQMFLFLCITINFGLGKKDLNTFFIFNPPVRGCHILPVFSNPDRSIRVSTDKSSVYLNLSSDDTKSALSFDCTRYSIWPSSVPLGPSPIKARKLDISPLNLAFIFLSLRKLLGYWSNPLLLDKFICIGIDVFIINSFVNVFSFYLI